MAGYYLDSSAAVKLYVAERGSLWLMALLDPARSHEAFVSRIAAVEVAAALFRRVRASTLAAGDAAAALTALRGDLVRTFRVVELSLAMIELAIDLAERHGLRGYDCVHLATLLVTNRTRGELGPLTLVSADAELNAAAVLEGIQVEDPNHHPP